MRQQANNSDVRTEASPYYGAVGAYGGFSDQGDLAGQGFGLLDLLALMRRRWELILGIAILGTLVAAVFGFTRAEVYSATAKLLIETEHRVVDLDSVVEGVGSDAIAIETQINLLKSRSLLERFASQSLLGVPISADLFSEMVELKGEDVTGVLAKQTLAQESMSIGPEFGSRQPVLSQTVNQLASGLNVSQEGRSFIIKIGFSSRDPSEAAELANGLAEFYIQDQSNLRRDATNKASNFLEGRLRELKSDLLAAEEEIQKYRVDNPQKIHVNINATSEQLLDLTSLLVRARADRKEREARLRFIAKLRSSGESLGSLTEVLSSPYMATLWEEDSKLRSQAAELRMELGDKHPRIQTIAAERNEVGERIDREVERIIENTKNELDVLIERERSLQEDLNSFSGIASSEAAVADKAQIQLRILEGNADASRRIYEEFLVRLKQTREQEAIVQSNTRLVARAQVPTRPSSGSPIRILLMGFLGSCAAGFGLAFLREKTDNKVKTGKDLVQSLGVDYLGLTPRYAEKEMSGQKIHDYLAEKPASVYAETIRSIYTRSIMSDEEEPKVFLITSSLPNEGKTTFSLSLAALLGMDGKKTVLVDLDIRHPSVFREMGIKDCRLADSYFEGNGDFDRKCLNKHSAGFDFVITKDPVKNPGRAIRSRRLEAMIAALKEKYDCVIIDSAPSLGLSDSKVLLGQVDACLFLVKWNETSFKVVSDALEEMKSPRDRIAGIVLTQVDLKKQMRYGYGGLDEYYGSNKNYYKN